jgi:pimeloyl-ACP methyl ester carboxylesterase
MTATEAEQLPWWKHYVVGVALGCFVGSILLATLLQVAAAVLIVTGPTSPWGWTLAAVAVSTHAPVTCFKILGVHSHFTRSELQIKQQNLQGSAELLGIH